MKTTWHRASFELLGSPDQEAGSVSLFFDYNLSSWCFGIALTNDPHWYDFCLEFGPLIFTLTYWRRYTFKLSD